jgi:hypothetical protein
MDDLLFDLDLCESQAHQRQPGVYHDFKFAFVYTLLKLGTEFQEGETEKAAASTNGVLNDSKQRLR